MAVNVQKKLEGLPTAELAALTDYQLGRGRPASALREWLVERAILHVRDKKIIVKRDGTFVRGKGR